MITKISSQNIFNPYQVRNNNLSKLLPDVLFGKTLPATANISFGWSKHLTELEKNILETITDPTNKNIMVSSHIKPDSDACGSNIGICGILESLNKNVYSIINDNIPKIYGCYPSAIDTIEVEDYIKGIKELNKVEKLDVAIFTDTVTPLLLNCNRDEKTNTLLDAVLKKNPKKVIIIDHHPDEKNKPSNYNLWKKELLKRGFKEENILYWRENRASASEMVAELDHEIQLESPKRSITNYNPNYYHGYRLSPALGIANDAGGPIHSDINEIKFQRLSKQKAPDTDISKTRYYFDWLINNSGINRKNVNLKDFACFGPSNKILDELKGILDGKLILEGVEVHLPTKNNPLGYIIIDNMKGIDEYVEKNKNQMVIQRYLLNNIKFNMFDRLQNDKNAGVFVLAKKMSNNNYYLTIRSYGLNELDGELYTKGHVFGESLAQQITDNLPESLGVGGGHANSTGFKSHKNVDFKTQLLPIIQKTVDRYVKENPDLTKSTGRVIKLNSLNLKGIANRAYC
ncbi:MAG: bifunctional oligoribonuclease/PAP phosphatase NrnA [Vampirovibrionia bacterium]